MKSKYRIKNIELNSHSRSILERFGIYDIRDLSKIRRHIFFNKKGVGPRIMVEIESVMDDYNIKWRAPLNLSREEMIRDILNAMHYSDGSYYVGSMATAHVCSLLNQSYGHHDLSDGLKKAKDETIVKVYEYLQSYIDHMKEYPTSLCPLCKSVVRKVMMAKDEAIEVVIEYFTEMHKKFISPDHFVIEFHDSYVKTLTKQIGLKAAKKRLLEEGIIALKLQLDKLTEE